MDHSICRAVRHGAANGNTVFINSNGTGLSEIGRVTDSSNLFLDLAVNYCYIVRMMLVV